MAAIGIVGGIAEIWLVNDLARPPIALENREDRRAESRRGDLGLEEDRHHLIFANRLVVLHDAPSQVPIRMAREGLSSSPHSTSGVLLGADCHFRSGSTAACKSALWAI